VFPGAFGMIGGSYSDGVISTPLFDLNLDWTMAQGDFFVILHNMFSYKVRNPAMDKILVGWVNAQLINNEFTILAETMMEHCIVRPNACVIGEWDSAPA
jgi:hypothetical protein